MSSTKTARSRKRRTTTSAAICSIAMLASCKHSSTANPADSSSDGAIAESATVTSLDASVDASPPPARPGMVWIPAGNLRAGTPADHVPRIADEELAGVDTPMNGFYIDQLPYPDEVGAIPTSNVSRADASKMCIAKGKRLCSELEWERACKGDANTTYEYGDNYDKTICGTGVPVEQSSKRPNGDRLQCKSSFGAQEMHGGLWEWTDSTWQRGTHGDLGVLRGGNARAGELVGRCANAIARKPKTTSPTMGFRCCAGDRNSAEVNLSVETLPAFQRIANAEEAGAPIAADAVRKWDSVPDAGSVDPKLFSARAAWRWHPVANEELIVVSGCVANGDGKRPYCGTVIARAGVAIKIIDGGYLAPEVAEFGESRRIRMQSVDDRSAFVREITYVVGMIQLGPLKR